MLAWLALRLHVPLTARDLRFESNPCGNMLSAANSHPGNIQGSLPSRRFLLPHLSLRRCSANSA